ncbi:MAG: crossover junction endodeoxyribonuclease RuvC [Pirellulales bacterium]|nr:crossover junction endodeoxyribonuclease RuvC [Pirellulales bacterium]
MLILGIDPGLNTTGYGLLRLGGREPELVEAGIIRPGSAEREFALRLQELHAGIAEILAQHQPVALALEQLYSHYEHPRTSILMGHARGVICLAGAQAGIPVIAYSATQIKKTLTGNGRAPKTQMQLAIQRELRLPALPEPADVADALAIALCHAYAVKSRV